MSDELNCQLSAFVDDELAPEEAELLVRRLCRDQSLRHTTASYALIGDVLRGAAAVTAPADFANRVMMAVEGQTTSTETRKTEPRTRSGTNWGMAIAASVVLAVIALMTLPDRSPELADSVIADSGAIAAESDTPVIPLPFEAPVFAAPQTAGVAPGRFDVPVVLSADRQSAANRARLNMYLLRHASSTGASRQGMVNFRNVGFVTQTGSER